MNGTRGTQRRSASMALALLACAVLAAGCLGKPKIEDRWTRIDVEGSSLRPYQQVSAGRESVQVSTAITYRSILTGFAVAELRASASVTPASVQLDPDAPRLRMAQDIDNLLANSVTLGRGTRAITGWDHLIQRIDFSFGANIPAAGDTTAAGGVFLVCYLAQGDEVERADGTDTLIVTPFPSTPYEILPIGMELSVASPGNR